MLANLDKSTGYLGRQHMRPSHSNGEDKPPLNLSTDAINRDAKDSPRPSLSGKANSYAAVDAFTQGSAPLGASNVNEHPVGLDQTSDHEQGHPYKASSTATSRDATTDRCTTPNEASCGEVEHDSAYTQAPNHPSAIFKREASSNENNEEPTSTEKAIIADDHTYPEGGVAAWLVVFGSFSGMVASFGILNSVGTFQAYLSTHQLAQHSPSSIGWIFSLFAFLTFFCGVQIGPVFDAKGPRWLVAAGSIFLFAGLMGVAESTSMSEQILFISLPGISC